MEPASPYPAETIEVEHRVDAACLVFPGTLSRSADKKKVRQQSFSFCRRPMCQGELPNILNYDVSISRLEPFQFAAEPQHIIRRIAHIVLL